jgi:hypothetical protein
MAPTEQWSVPFYVLTQPLDHKRRLSVLVVSSTGRLMLAGKVDTAKVRSPFVLRPVKQPGTFPVTVEGMIENGAILLHRVRVSSGRLPPIVPEPKMNHNLAVQASMKRS